MTEQMMTGEVKTDEEAIGEVTDQVIGEVADQVIIDEIITDQEMSDQQRKDEEPPIQKITSVDQESQNKRYGHGEYNLTSHLLFAIAAAGGGAGFQHGYNTGVINAPQSLLVDFVKETYQNRYGEVMEENKVGILISTLVAAFCLGGMIGALLSSYAADYIGRKWGLIWNNILVFVGAILEGCSKEASSYEMFIIGRFIIGINCGLNAALGPMYLSEISPVNFRGAIGSIYQLTITVTILISQVMGLPELFGNDSGWPYVFALAFIPAVMMMIALYFCPESPKYLLNIGEAEQAKQAIQWILESENVEEEMTFLKNEIDDARSLPKVTLKDMANKEVLKKPLIVSVVIMMAQQFSGINAAMYYSTQIFKAAGVSERSAVYCTMGMGVVNVLTTIVSVILVERVGRKILFLVGMAGMAILCIILTISMSLKNFGHFASYISVITIFCFVIMFAIGPGSIPWFIVSELFTQNARSLATSIAVGTNWGCNFIVSIGFMPLFELLKNFSFLIFLVFLVLSSLFIYLKVPETKNKTIEEIQEYFRSETSDTAGLPH
ncbi:solute carrier family 2, facilitated glucose transporter member 1-like [Parasteatoda tepidariorum]|uniref:solute carrier family 2, facilitated glucose transporter member 1-like n=1 Tax=Parasteatoda tepidariorum TaxID=114398 RepID=UPI001C71B0A3|nr:solute carrier family 2, facilitated glucose transporter member 1-like [Parasteatoda tepidariorum]